ncbi:DUF397 domain-containing protein [Goodfellowiella coeruleoviolacea]|uniref:DUF397 domain-containing protein n=1 Tax=Goodfellowiella coeruleoviolacea TaxID=334858 RepID=UPI002646DAAD|nr:DUF397 domain-containing protein [Goodfellowiella coeruleoviolacea]
MSTWRKSSYSGQPDNNCVEMLVSVDRSFVRDSKRPAAGTLTFESAAFAAFLSAVKGGRLDVRH